MKYTVLSPWAEVSSTQVCALNPRLDTLNGRTIGMFSHFKGHSPYILREVEKEILKKYPEARFSYLQYPKDTREIKDDAEFQPVFKAWLDGVDGVIAAYGDAGSCAMYHAFNTAYVERCGKPAAMLTKGDIFMSAQRGASARHVPHLRFVKCPLQDLSFAPVLDEALINDTIRPAVVPVVDQLIDGLLRPLTEEEKATPEVAANQYARETFTGTLDEVNDHFYRRGWNNGLPIVPPTEESVAEMLTGTDYPRDYVVAELPPMLGKATVEKIAVNAVMAGCLPTYLPVLIAAVKGMVDPAIHLVGWTCSVAGFAPITMINGPIRRDIGLNCGNNLLSGYNKPNAAIARALALITMNISGCRPTLEDNAYTGHEARFGVCFGEDEENSPWKPFHTEFGLDENDNAVTLAWSHHRSFVIGGKTGPALLHAMLQVEDPGGFDPGCTYVISPVWAKMLADMGMSRRDVRTYIGEYARKAAGNSPLRWMRDNNHMPKDVPLPESDSSLYVRKFWTTEHLNIMVGGTTGGPRCCAFAGGGDHGGPSCTKIELPKCWPELVKKYSDMATTPDYIVY